MSACILLSQVVAEDVDLITSDKIFNVGARVLIYYWPSTGVLIYNFIIITSKHSSFLSDLKLGSHVNFQEIFSHWWVFA